MISHVASEAEAEAANAAVPKLVECKCAVCCGCIKSYLPNGMANLSLCAKHAAKRRQFHDQANKAGMLKDVLAMERTEPDRHLQALCTYCTGQHNAAAPLSCRNVTEVCAQYYAGVGSKPGRKKPEEKTPYDFAALINSKTVGVLEADDGIMSAMAYADYVDYYTSKAPSYMSCTDAGCRLCQPLCCSLQSLAAMRHSDL
ncbi:unnamed protein product [Symbiodinium sp. CCMP2592]|nr:unnamed protein product [Symbiodinium sp. CCMP2592]